MLAAANEIVSKVSDGSVRCLVGASGQWRCPSEVLLGPRPGSPFCDAQGSPIIDSSSCQQLCGQEFVASDMAGTAGARAEAVLTLLGVAAFSPSVLVKCLTSPQALSVVQQRQPSWFAHLSGILSQLHGGQLAGMPSDGWKQMEQAAPIFRLSNGTVTARKRKQRNIYLWDRR
jgi:hypothetical protein